MSAAPLTIEQFPEKLAVVQLAPGADIPTWAESSSIFSITATATETSLVCAGRSVPTKAPGVRGLIGFALAGASDPTSVGVVVELLAPLADEDISVMTLTTFGSVWVLVQSADVDRATEAWRRRGHHVAAAVPVK
ncbi:MAG: ACT domain-containing protein [Nocardioides sp.]